MFPRRKNNQPFENENAEIPPKSAVIVTQNAFVTPPVIVATTSPYISTTTKPITVISSSPTKLTVSYILYKYIYIYKFLFMDYYIICYE